MTVAEIKAKIAEYEEMLEKAEAAESDFVLDVDEAEREKQHQEDLQRIRGFRLIDDDFMNAVFDENIEGTDELFNDGEHIIYVNGDDKDSSTELGKLMRDFFCTNADDMHYKELAEKVRYFKEDEKGVQAMCKVMEDMRKEAAINAVEKDRIKNALEMLADGLSIDKVARYSQLAIERVRELAVPKAIQ